MNNARLIKTVLISLGLSVMLAALVLGFLFFDNYQSRSAIAQAHNHDLPPANRSTLNDRILLVQ